MCIVIDAHLLGFIVYLPPLLLYKQFSAISQAEILFKLPPLQLE